MKLQRVKTETKQSGCIAQKRFNCQYLCLVSIVVLMEHRSHILKIQFYNFTFFQNFGCYTRSHAFSHRSPRRKASHLTTLLVSLTLNVLQNINHLTISNILNSKWHLLFRARKSLTCGSFSYTLAACHKILHFSSIIPHTQID